MKQAVNIQQTSTSTGTGDLTLAAAATGYRDFSDAIALKPASGSQSGIEFVPYYIESEDGSEWEFGASEVQDDASNGVLKRSGTGAVVFESSNSDASVNFSAGTKTIRLITPPEIRDFDRGVQLTSSSNSMANQARISWTAETGDTDAMWDGSDAEFIYPPLWAKEIEINLDIAYYATAATDTPIAVEIQHYSFDEPDIYIPGILQNATNYLTYISTRRRMTIDTANISGNPIDNTDRASFRVKFWNPDLISVSTLNAWLRVRIVR